ncbi:MAG: type pilin accessory protein [Cellvibrio sp.]|jgi:hypothetical protein|nr:type pilin accessory protein [Cellvibrio sp.]
MNYKLRLFGIHILISFFVAVVSSALIFKIWYPYPLANAVGVQQIFLILLGVDVILGPFLTLLVAKKGKRTLSIDLSIIAFIQIAAYLYGMHTMAAGRPAWLVFNTDRFDLVQMYQIDTSNLENAASKYQMPGWWGPKWVSTKLPDDKKEREKIKMEALFGGSDVPQRPDLYIDYESDIDNIRNHALPLSKLIEFNSQEAIDRILNKWPKANSYLPLRASISDAVVLIDSNSGKVISIVDLRPW